MASRFALALGIVLAWLGAASVLAFLPPGPALAGVCLLSGALVWLHIVRAGRTDRRVDSHRVRPPRAGRALLAGAVAAVAVFAPALGTLMTRYVPVPQRPDYFEGLMRAGGWAAVAVLQAVFAPILEELVFRGWIQGALEERMRAALAIPLAALLFGAVHGTVVGLPFFTAVGVLFGAAAWAWDSLWAAIALHIAFNGSQLLLEALEKAGRMQPLARLSTPVLALWVLGALALGLALLARAAAAGRRARAAEARLGAKPPVRTQEVG